MHSEVRQFIQNTTFSRESVEQMAGMLPSDDAELDAWISEAVANDDLLSFMLIVVAALHLERPVHARHLARGARLLPGSEYLDCVVWRMTGDMPEYLLEGMRNTVMNRLCEAAGLFVIALWCEEHRGGTIPDEVIPRARAMARRLGGDYTALGFLLALAIRRDDLGLLAVLRLNFPNATDEKWNLLKSQCTGLADKVLAVCRSPILEVIPEEPIQAFARGTVVRSVPRIGRNEPCPCGSGKKYKHCCFGKDQDRLQHSSEVEGLTVRELYQNPEPYLTTARMERTGPVEVARFDVMKIPRALLPSYFLRLAAFNLFDSAAESFEKLGYDDDLEGAWDTAMFASVRAGRKDIGERLMKVRAPSGFTEEQLDLSQKLLLAGDDAAKCLNLIEQAAMKALATEDLDLLLELAYAVTFSKFSALGILLYRGVIALAGPEEAAASYEQLLIARDRLNLRPDDPIGEVIDARLAREKDETSDAVALREARENFEAKRREVRALKDSIEQLEKEIVRREKASDEVQRVQPAPADDQSLRDLRTKVGRLQSIISEKHAERNVLRNALERTQKDLEKIRRSSASPSAEADTDNEEDLLMPQEAEGHQPVRLLEFPRNFQHRLGEFPRHIARGAMSMLGRLAAGEPAAFIGAVRLKACPSVMRQRIGIDFRILFRLHPDRVQVVDLIPRQDLERRIKELSS